MSLSFEIKEAKDFKSKLSQVQVTGCKIVLMSIFQDISESNNDFLTV
jgi:hypothetical protein